MAGKFRKRPVVVEAAPERVEVADEEVYGVAKHLAKQCHDDAWADLMPGTQADLLTYARAFLSMRNEHE